jgi:hypothetical protein
MLLFSLNLKDLLKRIELVAPNDLAADHNAYASRGWRLSNLAGAGSVRRPITLCPEHYADWDVLKQGFSKVQDLGDEPAPKRLLEGY